MVQSVLNSKPINQPSCTILHHSGSSIFAFWCYLLGHNALPEGCRYTNRGSLPRGTQQRSFGRSSERAGRSHCYLDAEVKSPRNQGRIQPLPSTKTQQEKTQYRYFCKASFWNWAPRLHLRKRNVGVKALTLLARYGKWMAPKQKSSASRWLPTVLGWVAAYFADLDCPNNGRSWTSRLMMNENC